MRITRYSLPNADVTGFGARFFEGRKILSLGEEMATDRHSENGHFIPIGQ
jgi:hypothetical protein